MISERVKQLRQQSLNAHAALSSERAELMTDFYQQQSELNSTPVLRALAFRYVLEHKSICINPGEMIVGEKGPVAKAAPTYPELCCHSLQDLDILNSREKISFAVSSKVRQTYAEKIIPFWHGKSMRELIFKEMTSEWQAAYNAGIFTEFMEQRAPGHTVLDDKIYRKGFVDFKADIQKSLEHLNFMNDPQAYAKEQELLAMDVCADALIVFACRHAEKAREILAQLEKCESQIVSTDDHNNQALHDRARATEETGPANFPGDLLSDPEKLAQWKKELLYISEICEWVPAHAPRTFWEALQYYWFVHMGVTTELNTWDSFCPGRLDQHLYPFYQKEISDGTLTRERAEELLQCFWIKFNNQPAPPKVGVTAAESGTYTDFAQINTGGLKHDGTDGVNDLTFLILDVIEEMRLLQPSSSIQVSQSSPDRFIHRAARIIRSGFGQPSVFNSDVIVQELVRQGKSIADARDGGSSGCVEVGAFGKENYNLTGYFNLPKVLEITLNNGTDPRSGLKIGLETGDPATFASFAILFTAFEQQLRYFVDIKIRGNNVIERLYASYMPAPFLSLLIDDCILSGTDYHDGGARYNTSYIQGVGLGSVTDALTGIKYLVYDKNSVTMNEILSAMRVNFAGHERLRHQLLNKTPKYGNDDDYADRVMKDIFNAYFDAIDGRPNTKGGVYHINLLPTTVHIYFGSVLGAMPDGRKAGEPLSEGVSPVQGADRHGPTAVLKSVAKMDHVRTGGTLLNQKFSPQLLQNEAGLERLTQLVRSYFKMDGHHIQFNVVDAAVLRDAQTQPEKHRDLIVRVAGYSDYFCDLTRALQDEIISRTQHQDI
jgi:trans-4-hydroxy-L-proline dehydratase